MQTAQEDYPFETHPVQDGVSIVHLARALSYISGSEVSFPGSNLQSELMNSIGRPENVIFIIVDGLGTHFVDSLEKDAFFRKNMVARLNSVFPSTTASSLTTFATGLWPSQHGITGWWTYLPELGEPVTALPFQRKRDSKPVEQLGVSSGNLYVGEPFLRTAGWNVSGIIPKSVSASAFSRFALGDNPIHGYDGLEHGFGLLSEMLDGGSRENYIYIYLM